MVHALPRPVDAVAPGGRYSARIVENSRAGGLDVLEAGPACGPPLRDPVINTHARSSAAPALSGHQCAFEPPVAGACISAAGFRHGFSGRNATIGS